MLKKIFIKNRKGLNMAVRLNIDEKNTKLVFLQHGLSSRKEYPHMLVLEECFSNFGYNVVNFDATNSINESGSSSDSITISGHCEDLEDIINWSETQDFYTEPFALAGQSLGACSVVRFAGLFPNKVNLLLPISFPFYDKLEIKESVYAQEIIKNGYFDKISKNTGRILHMTSAYVEDMKKLNLTPQIKNITAETYVIIGSKDTEKHLKNSKYLYNTLSCKKELYLLEEIPHDLANTPKDKELFRETLINILEKNE